ncbi:MAG: glycerate kinase [Pseudomonadota bacterium]
MSDQIEFLRALFDEAVRVADPMVCVARNLPAERPEKILVIGAGKASARMGEALEAAWGPCDGLIITRYGYERPLEGITLRSASHPVPDEAGVAATRELRSMVEAASDDTTIVALISGGGSALLVDPAGALSLAEKQAINEALLGSGAPINQMNVVRKHLSRIKGGQLAAAAYPARLVALMISDVPGDDPAFIASGPTIGDVSTADDALKIVKRWGINLPPTAQAVLNDTTGVVPPDDRRLTTTENRIIAAPSQSLEAAAAVARSKGYAVKHLGDAIEGEARDVGRDHASIARTLSKFVQEPTVILSGGECTVTRRGDGIGGPNAEYALSLCANLAGARGIYGLACDTDGVDGAAEVAGAVFGPETYQMLHNAGIDPAEALERNDAHTAFATIGAQVITGPTLTNVNDFRAILVEPHSDTAD